MYGMDPVTDKVYTPTKGIELLKSMLKVYADADDVMYIDYYSHLKLTET